MLARPGLGRNHPLGSGDTKAISWQMKDMANIGYRPQKLIGEAMARHAARAPSFEAAYQATRVMSISFTGLV
jgi:hypothetical protein